MHAIQVPADLLTGIPGTTDRVYVLSLSASVTVRWKPYGIMFDCRSHREREKKACIKDQTVEGAGSGEFRFFIQSHPAIHAISLRHMLSLLALLFLHRNSGRRVLGQSD